MKSDRDRNLELDGFCEELKLAFEHNGRQHYEIIGKFKMTEESLSRQKRNDYLKIKACKDKGITLIIIPELFHYVQIEKLKDFIKEQLEENNYPIPENYDDIKIDINSIYKKENK
jgi:hypothetical protein